MAAYLLLFMYIAYIYCYSIKCTYKIIFFEEFEKKKYQVTFVYDHDCHIFAKHAMLAKIKQMTNFYFCVYIMKVLQHII